MKRPQLYQSALVPAFLLYAIVAFSAGTVGSTHLYLIEQSVCRDYYDVYEPQNLPDGGHIDETLCKNPEIQSRVAQINGIYRFLCFVPRQSPPSLRQIFQSHIYSHVSHRTLGKADALFREEKCSVLERLGLCPRTVLLYFSL
jgi:hypothetical protein